jgi:hypothetical protein
VQANEGGQKTGCRTRIADKKTSFGIRNTPTLPDHLDNTFIGIATGFKPECGKIFR